MTALPSSGPLRTAAGQAAAQIFPFVPVRRASFVPNFAAAAMHCQPGSCCTLPHPCVLLSINAPLPCPPAAAQFWEIKPSNNVNNIMRYRITLNGRTYCFPDTHGQQPDGGLAQWVMQRRGVCGVCHAMHMLEGAMRCTCWRVPCNAREPPAFHLLPCRLPGGALLPEICVSMHVLRPEMSAAGLSRWLMCTCQQQPSCRARCA